MDGKKCPEVSNTPTPKSLNNSDDVIEHIRSWIQLDIKSKMHEDAVKHIESFVDRQISCLESTVVERQYVKVVLEMWLRKSLRKAIDYLNDETIDISVEMPTLLKELNSINSFEDIGLKLNEAVCQLTNLCDPGCQYLQLILDQVDLFKNTLRFSVLVASYFKQFKASCIDKVFSRCLDDVGKDQTNGMRNRELIVALNALLQVASEDVGIQNVLEKSFTGKDFDDANGKDLINQLVEIFESYSVTSKNESSEWFNELKSGKEWEPKLQVLIKETCKAFLFPKTTIEIKEEYGRKIIFIKGVSVFVSKIIEEMQRLKESNPEVQEIQIVGLSSVHIDRHLENETWHGTNVGIVADMIFVDYEVCQKDQKNTAQAKEETTESLWNYNFEDDFRVCWDVSGINGEPCRPGMSGGNVHIICNEMLHAERWKVISDGGKGGDGQNGSDGTNQPTAKGNARKWSKEYFNQVFPSMSTFETGEQMQDIVPDKAVKTVLRTLNDLLPVENRKSGKDILPDFRSNFFVEGTAKDGSEITVSYYQSETKRHTLLLCQGSSIGQGGFGGNIVFEFVSERNSIPTESRVPFVGKENLQPRAARMGVYEAMGLDGVMGTPAGDVGFIHRLDTSEASADKNVTGEYIGFENDVSLKIERKQTKPSKQQDSPDNYYAKLQKGVYASIACSGFPAFGQVQPLHSTVVKTAKKKAVVRQSLAQHVVQVEERKQVTQCLQAKLFNSWEEEQSFDNVEFLVSQMEDKETQLHQLTSQCGRGLENVGSTRFVKPALKYVLDENSVLDTSRSLVSRRTVGCRPVDFRQEPPVDIRCLDMIPTMSGVDSAIHSIFGQMNSSGLYVCNDVKMYRHNLATFIHKKENRDKVAPSIKQFVLRVQKSDKLNYPVASDVKIAYSKCRRTNCEANEFNWEKETESENLFKEYAKFVETPSNSLESAEVEMLAIIHSIPVHVYNDQSSYFKYKETLNPENSSRSLVLDLGNGEWRRLQANEMVENFRKTIDDDLFEYQPIQSHYFRKFLDSLEKQSANQQIIASMKMHNPENGDTPDKLFQLLLESFRDEENRENLNVELIDQYSNDLCWLAELIEKHNSRNLSPIFYLNIVKNSLPVDWRCDFLMLEIYDRCTQESSDIDELGDIRDELYKIARGMPSLVPLLCNLIATSDSCAALQPQNLLRLIKLIAEDCEEKDRIINQQLSELQLLPLSDWYYHLRSKMWEKEISPLLTNSITPKQHKKLQNDVICMLLEIETNNDEEFCNELLTNAPDLKTAVALLRRALYPGASYSQDNVEKNVEHLIAAMRKDESKLPSSAMSLGYSWLLDDVQDVVEKSKIKSNQEANKLEYKLKEKKIQKLIKEWQTDGLKLNHTSIVDFVFVYDYAVQKKCTKKGDEQTFRLRDTQRVTIVTLLLSEGKNVLTQVSTGEGKSLIVAGVAIAFALCRNKENKKKKIDVITSNDVLARRDSTLTVADCGLRDLYEYFNVSVANNCSQWVDERTQAYNAIVVYGQLANFQRDYLLDNFYDHNIRGDRTMDLAIIDEVDCMLLDRGSNTLYLSHDIPGMEMLESLYVFIWGKIRSSSNGSNHIEIIKSIKSAILHDLYGAITKDDLESIHSPLKDKPSEKNALWDHLVETKVIDLQGRLLMEDTIESINFNPQINPKVKFYLSSVAKRERSIRIPEHLMPFVDLHLDTWLNNAMQALELKRDEDYVVDQDRTDTNPNLNPQVIIIDRDTGMDQTSSQWDGALHQFVQLKEGCKLTSQCLKAIFVSNAKYVQSYEKTVGVSGTLGSGPERDFLLRNYSSIPVEIPTAFQKRFYLRPTRIFSSEEHWLHAIVKEARQIIVPEDRAKARSLVIFCQSINNVNIIYRYLKNAFKGQIKANHIHCYTRDYEKFAFEGKPLGVGHVIIATNLAGRGTDIKISDQLRENGGLHICLTFLSKNERIEEQAIGRTARNGAPGSGIFLLWETSPMVKKWGAGKWLSMKEERQWREKQRISRLQEDFGDTEFEKSLFDKLSDYYSKLKRKLKEEKREHQEIKTICDSVLDKWALWLDQREDHISYMAGYQLELPDCSTTDISWMTPVRSVTMAKHLSLQKSSLSEAGEILKRIIDSKDSELYPAAHYYFAFVLIQEGFQENKTKFIQILQKCETILSNDIEKHLSFYRKVALATPDQAPSFCVIDAYKQQKDNIVKILEYFIGSVRALLGSHYCSVSNLIEAGKEEKKEKNFLKKAETFLQNKRLEFARFQKERKSKCKSEQTPKICPEQADKLFELMVEKKCITCRLNDTDTIPNRDAIIQQVANEHGIEKLIYNLKIVFGGNLTEEQIEKNLKKENLIPCTRKAFWEELRNKGVLQAVKGGLCSKMKCVIVLESECDAEPNKLNSKKLNRENRIKIEDFQFGLDSFDRENNCMNVLYNPIYDNMSDLLKQKKIMFSKEYVIEQLGEEEYRCRKEKFELNKIAQLNLKKLEIVKLKGSCSLGKNDLMRANIISDSEQGSVLKALIEQHVIDANGELSSNYQKFSYPECPAYEEPVMRVIGRIFVAEIVKRQWLRAAQDANCLKAINLLPLKPYRDLLGDLMAAHIISGARVTEDAILIEEETKEIEDEDERECVRKFLKSRQAVYAPRMEKSEIFLDVIERDIRKIPNTVNVSTELYTFDLAAFNHVIDIKDAKSSWKSYLGATFAGAVGIASIGVGIFLIHGKMLSFGFSKNLLLMGGASDILYAITTILTHSKFTWADYTRQRLRSAMGKTEPIEMIKTIYKLCDSSENADFRKTINLAIGLERWKRQQGGQINKIHETLLGRSVKQVGLINHQTEFHFHMQLHYLLQDFSSFILRKTKKCVTKNFTEIRKALTQFNELHGLKTSQDFVREKLNQLISHWAAEGQKWVCAIIDETTLKLNEIAGTGGVPLTQEIADKGIRLMESIFNYYEVRMKLVRVTVTCIREFLLGLENHANPEDPIAKNIDVEEFKLFQKKMMADIDSELERQVAKILGILRQRIH